jgi:hypothetical protein
MFRENYGGDEQRIGTDVNRNSYTAQLKLEPVFIYLFISLFIVYLMTLAPAQVI